MKTAAERADPTSLEIGPSSGQGNGQTERRHGTRTHRSTLVAFIASDCPSHTGFSVSEWQA